MKTTFLKVSIESLFSLSGYSNEGLTNYVKLITYSGLYCKVILN